MNLFLSFQTENTDQSGLLHRNRHENDASAVIIVDEPIVIIDITGPDDVPVVSRSPSVKAERITIDINAKPESPNLLGTNCHAEDIKVYDDDDDDDPVNTSNGFDNDEEDDDDSTDLPLEHEGLLPNDGFDYERQKIKVKKWVDLVALGALLIGLKTKFAGRDFGGKVKIAKG